MSWKYPKRVPQNGDALDFNDYNDAFQHVNEAYGRLNEHNFSNLLTGELQPEDVADDVYTKVTAERRTLEGYGAIPGSNPSHYTIRGIGTFVEIDGLATTITVGVKSRVRITVNYQVCMPFEGYGSPNDYVTVLPVGSPKPFAIDSKLYRSTIPPLCYIPAITINGSQVTETVQGDQDQGTSGATLEKGRMGQSFHIAQDIVVVLQPGSHRIAAAGRIERVRLPTEFLPHAERVASANIDQGILYVREDR